MNTKDLFIISCKLLSIYCFINGVPMLFGIFAPIFVKFDIPPELKTSVFLANIVSIFLPVFVIGAGFYLLKYSNNVYEFAFKGKERISSNVDKNLLVVLKACGIYLIIKYVPMVIQSITSFISVRTSHPVYEMLSQQQYLYQNAFSSIFSVSLGVYLLKSGKIFFKYIK